MDLAIITQSLVAGLSMGAIYSLIGLGFALYLRAMNLINFCHGETATIGALIAVLLTMRLGLPFLIVFPIAVTITGLIGLLLERVVFRPLWLNEEDPYLTRAVIATIAVGILMTNVAQIIGGPFAIRYPAPVGEEVIRVGSVVFVPQRILVLGVSVLALACLQLFLQHSKAGLAMRAVMLDRDTAQLMGIDVRRSIALTFVLSSALAAAAGILIAPIVFWFFNLGVRLGMKAFAALTFGGLHSFPGAIVGGLLIGVLESFTGLYLSSTYRDAIVFSILILGLLLRPQGLLGKTKETLV